jgi:3-dehydroquinate synthase
MTTLHYLDFNKIIEQAQAIESDTILFVMDERIWPIYKERLSFEQKLTNKKIISWRSAQGESCKKLSEYERCVEFFLEKDIHRRAHVISIGGGATSDFAGFVAATLLRGIDWTVVPTTLLSMVDAAIGGKVALNSRFGKNLVGAFHPPRQVWVNFAFLKSLPPDELLSGKGEILKYAFLDKKINQLVHQQASLEELIKACVEYKLTITEKDLHDKGIRRVLNLGHSLGHAIEKAYSLPHGVAIIWGLFLIFKLYNDQDMIQEWATLQEKLQITTSKVPWEVGGFPTSKILTYLHKDKKIIGLDQMDIVLLDSIGKPEVQKIKFTDLEEKIKNAVGKFTL